MECTAWPLSWGLAPAAVLICSPRRTLSQSLTLDFLQSLKPREPVWGQGPKATSPGVDPGESMEEGVLGRRPVGGENGS